jgi:hypothetical protein
MTSPKSRPPGTVGPRRGRSAAWLVASCVLILFPLAYWSRIPAGRRVFLPATPLDETNWELAREFYFLCLAAPSVPPGASFTPTAEDSNKESSLFFLSIGLLPDRRAFPSSYWDHPSPYAAAQADYRLDLGCSRGAPGFDSVTPIPGGCLRAKTESAP